MLTSATAETVRAAASALGYVPNEVARALSTGKASNLALIVPDIANPFFSGLMRGVQARAHESGYATFIGDSDETKDLEDILLGRLAPQVSGFILASPRLEKERIWFHAARRPLVVINRDIEGISRILVDSKMGFRRAVHHLADLGHRSIAYIGAPKGSWSNQERAAAVAGTGAERGLKITQINVSRPSHDAGRSCIKRFLKSGATAAMAVDDVVAQGMMGGLFDLGFFVPRDFSIVGCDDVIAMTTSPPLTTISTHCATAGIHAVELLLASLNAGSMPPQRHVVIGDLVLRSTTGPPLFRQLPAKRHGAASTSHKLSSA